jgi:hypothetical protein
MFGMPPPPEPEPTTVSGQDGNRQSVQDYAQELLDEGCTPLQVEQALLGEGLNGKAAAAVVREVTATRRARPGKARRSDGSLFADARDERLRAAEARALLEAGRRNMAIGGVACVGGMLVTVFSILGAQGPGGGIFIVAWGAILYGAAQFIRGASQTQAAKRQ